ncbi:MAG: hypothetical protein ACTHNI_13850, partial [Cellulosimicrobium cellulans]
PAIAPVVAFKERPAGSRPDAMDQVYDGAPPVAPKPPEYAVPTRPGFGTEGEHPHHEPVLERGDEESAW